MIDNSDDKLSDCVVHAQEKPVHTRAEKSSLSRDSRTPATRAAHDASLLKLKARQAEQMAKVDIQELLADVAGGLTQQECAARHGVAQSTISTWLNSQSGQLAKDIATARRMAADALADRALAALEHAQTQLYSAPAITLAGLTAKHWQWRASVADRARFSEKPVVDTAAPQAAPPSFSIRILTGSNSGPTTVDITPDNPAIESTDI